MSPDHALNAQMPEQGEEGVALFYAILATLIISGIAVILVTMATTELRVTSSSAAWESAIHAAEGGADTVVARVNDDSNHVTSSSGGPDHVYDPDSESPEDIETWAIGVAEADCELVRTGDGEACGIRPVDDVTGNPIDVVFGVGFVPSKDNPQATRVVRLEYDRGFLSTTKAILTGGDLEITGSADILGNAGNVHTNGNITVGNNAATVSGDVTYSGDIGSSSSPSITPQEAPPERIDPVTARGIYNERWNSFPGQWYDLCPDGAVKRPTAAGPCETTEADDILWEGETQTYLGWGYKKKADGTVTWSTSGGAPGDGIFYVYRGNAALGGAGSDPAVTMSVLLESESDDCSNTVQQGHFDLGANVSWRPFLADAMIIADGDIEVAGTPGQSFEGVMMAREQIEVTGNPTMKGSLIVEDRCDTLGSPVSDTAISGSMELTHDGDLLVPVSGIVRIIAWNEL